MKDKTSLFLLSNKKLSEIAPIQGYKDKKLKKLKYQNKYKQKQMPINSDTTLNLINVSDFNFPKETYIDYTEYEATQTQIIAEPTKKSEKDNSDTEDKKLPCLYICSEKLLEKANIINIYNKLYYFNGRCYDPVNKPKIIQLYRDYVDTTLGETSSLYSISNLYEFLLADSSLTIKNPKFNHRIAVLKDCVFDVENLHIIPHSPENIVFSYIDAKLVKNPHCSCFDNFLATVFDNNSILIKRVWMVIGYLLMQTNEAKAFFIMGEAPDSGKSLLGNFIQSLFPREYVSNLTLNDFNSRFGLVKLVGSAINVSLDLPSSELMPIAVSKLKMLTGGDIINVEEKFEPIFEFQNTAKLLFASNFPLSLSEKDEAFWNRVIYIPFNKSIPSEKQDKSLIHKFKEEKDSIVTKALIYANQLIKNDFIFPSTPEIDLKIKHFKAEPVPSISQFIRDKCQISSDCKGELMVNLYNAYQEYCVNANIPSKSYNELKKYLTNVLNLNHLKMRDG